MTRQGGVARESGPGLLQEAQVHHQQRKIKEAERGSEGGSERGYDAHAGEIQRKQMQATETLRRTVS